MNDKLFGFLLGLASPIILGMFFAVILLAIRGLS